MGKVLIITDAWAPQVNGIITSLVHIQKHLSDMGYDVRIVYPRLFKVIPLFFIYPEIKLAFFPRRKLEKMILAENPDYIHISTEGPLGFAARSICLKRGIPFTTSYHTHLPLYIKVRIGAFYGATYRYLRWFHRPSKAVLVSTKGLKEELEKHKFQNVRVCPLGIDTERFKRNPDSKAPRLPDPVFVYFGRIAKEKNVEGFLSLDLPGTKLIIGDGPARAKLEKRYRKSAIFTGYKVKQELVDWLSVCDVFVFPSRTDTFGLVVIEALACGIPVASYDTMGPKDVISPGIDGFIDNDLSRAAKECLSLVGSPACRKKALRYTWHNSAKIFSKNLYRIRKTRV